LIVLGGSVGIEQAAKKGGIEILVPFKPGRMDALIEQTDRASFDVLEPKADGFRNYISEKMTILPEKMLVDRAQLLTLTAQEMTVLLGGMRVLDINYNHSKTGVLTQNPGILSNDFFIHLLDMNIVWKPVDQAAQIYEGKDLETGKLRFTASRVDLIFGSNAELRAIAEVYAADDGKVQCMNDFIAAWCKVMDADRFDLKL